MLRGKMIKELINKQEELKNRDEKISKIKLPLKGYKLDFTSNGECHIWKRGVLGSCIAQISLCEPENDHYCIIIYKKKDYELLRDWLESSEYSFVVELENGN